MRSRPIPDRNLPHPPVAYTSSVPVSVYKELTAELHASRALAEALNAQNQQLLRQNQQLQQELDKAIESVLYWRQAANSQRNPRRPFPSEEVNSRKSPEKSSPFLPKTAKLPEIIEQEPGRYRRQPPERVSEIGGWSLAVAIVLIMVTAFGAGYFMMRPLVRSR
jgi:hypothetical protein